jgi:predicted RNA-binding protein YlqC (UPF0109 family)
MKKLLAFLVQNIVEKPSEVEISESKENDQVILKLKVAQEDMGKVIGKGGKVIRAIRNLVKVRAVTQKQKVFLQLEETPPNV